MVTLSWSVLRGARGSAGRRDRSPDQEAELEMKQHFVSDLLALGEGSSADILGWVANKRSHRNVVFIDLVDSTGSIQIVIADNDGPLFHAASHCQIDSALRVSGTIRQQIGKPPELQATDLVVVGPVTQQLSPSTRSASAQAHASVDHLLSNRHLYIRTPAVMAALRARSETLYFLHHWFHEHGYVDLSAPVLTALPLYDDHTAISLSVHDQNVYLTQCVGFYLEAAVHAFEKVYNLGPSFRAESSKSNRHLIEYWHIKAELAFVTRWDLMVIVQDIVRDLVCHLQTTCQDASRVLGRNIVQLDLETPFDQVSYREAIAWLATEGYDVPFGTGIGGTAEEHLSRRFTRPFWVVGIPRSIEPFPYVIDPNDHELTMTADLVAPGGYGELLGIAEKIHDHSMLLERMAEKQKLGNPSYDWLVELRTVGCVPHGGFGMGLERIIRWILQVDHVRDLHPFPRVIGRRIYP